MRDYAPAHPLVFRRLFLEGRPELMLQMVNGLLAREESRGFTGILKADHHYEYLNDRYDCEFVTLLCSTAGNEISPVILALDPHPQVRGRVLPRLAAMAPELCRTHSLSSPRAEGILLCSAAYGEYDKLRRITRIPLYCKLQARNEDVSLLVLNLFRLTIPFPGRALTALEEWMHFFSYADIYRRCEPTFPRPPYLNGRLKTLWKAYTSLCRDERLYWDKLSYDGGGHDEAGRLDEAIRRGRRGGKLEAREFLIAELRALKVEEGKIKKLTAPL